MSDRRRRTALHLPPPSGPVLLPRERQSSSTGSSGPSGTSGASGSGAPGSSGAAGTSGAPGPQSAGSGSPDSSSSGSAEDNPFAPPPEGRPDQPWQPRHPEHGGNSSSDGSGQSRGGWGSQWSSSQPGRSPGGFGSRPGGQNGQNGQGSGKDGPDGGRGGLRWDPTDPAQRRARYALLSGMWAFFFALFDFPEIALLLGALALYWGISSLRNKSKAPSSDTDGAADGTSPAAVRSAGTPAGTAQPGQAGETGRAAAFGGPGQSGAALPASSRPQTTAAVSGLVTAVIALAIVATTFTVQLVYRDYYTCLNDALTTTGQLSCNDLLPDSLVPVFGVKE
ncbi:hypothetical protein [Streptomyces sp. 35G-GA-8]|uniref:hypothetical protein n=1 Tax=Streptomyces sp. 35G-GA-8 TaxID=2939434 RepID=UPI00201F601C|nr:hypothetical protein [Streptomyces sp. 35G-GA-8]MCL7376225.1 hypothetical protein [Streptomyces sp. 35G-GA-8]